MTRSAARSEVPDDRARVRYWYAVSHEVKVSVPGPPMQIASGTRITA